MFASLRLATLVTGLLIGSAAVAEMRLKPAAIAEPLIEIGAGAIAAPAVTQTILIESGSDAAVGQAAVSPAQPVADSPVPTAASPAVNQQAEIKPVGDMQASAPRQRPLPSRSGSAGPSVAASGGLAALVAKFRATSVASRELECLAGAIYFESKSEPLIGQLAVGQVVANRTKSGRFPASYCGVVFQRGQFSFVRNRSMPAIAKSSLQWRTAVAIAQIVDRAMHAGDATKALFFHARRVSPKWRLTRLATIGNHVFYR